jgi:hypothetical protein
MEFLFTPDISGFHDISGIDAAVVGGRKEFGFQNGGRRNSRFAATLSTEGNR